MKKHSLKNSKINIFDVMIISFLVIFTIIAAYPFFYTIIGSFNEGLDFEYGGIWLYPRAFTLANYRIVFEDSRLYRAFINTVMATVFGVALSLIFTSCIAYAMSQNNLKGKKFFWYFNLITMFFSGGLVPLYITIVLIGLYDSFFVYIVPAMYSVYNMIVLTSFFRSIDKGISDSARIDGANEIQIWWKLYLPIAKPALATVGLWLAVNRWNSYLPTLIFTKKDESIWLLQYYLMRLIRDSSLPAIDGNIADEVNKQTITFAAIIIASVPIICVYPFISKYFSKGLMLGSMKG